MKCKTCGARVIKFPLWKGQGSGVPFRPFSWNKINWINLFKMDMYSVVLFCLIVFLIIGYKADIKKCEDVIEYPCEFCEKSNCCQVDWEKLNIDSSRLLEIQELVDLTEIVDTDDTDNNTDNDR